jgi:cytochrome c oxidase subunit 3
MSSHGAATTHDAEVAQTAHYDPEAGKIGMWLFLFTEVLLFGTLFISFAVYLQKYRFDFQQTSDELSRLIGAANTLILLTSSLTMALAIAAMERGKKALSQALLAGTIAFGLVFLVIKSFEWGGKFAHDLYPQSATMLAKPLGEQVFYGLYFTMTGLHALHVVIGAVAIGVAMVLVQRGRIRADRVTFLHNTGLYWHLVDLVWIFLFPLFYLIG